MRISMNALPDSTKKKVWNLTYKLRTQTLTYWVTTFRKTKSLLKAKKASKPKVTKTLKEHAPSIALLPERLDTSSKGRTAAHPIVAEVAVPDAECADAVTMSRSANCRRSVTC